MDNTPGSTDEKELLNRGYNLVAEAFERATYMHTAASSEYAIAQRFRRHARALFWFNLGWAGLNLYVSLTHRYQQHGAHTDQAGILAGPGSDVGRGVSAERRSDARVYPPGLPLVDR